METAALHSRVFALVLRASDDVVSLLLCGRTFRIFLAALEDVTFAAAENLAQPVASVFRVINHSPAFNRPKQFLPRRPKQAAHTRNADASDAEERLERLAARGESVKTVAERGRI